MNKIVLIMLVSMVTASCGSLMKPRIVERKVVPVKSKFSPRSVKYISCIRELNNDGVRQSMLKTLCDSALGSVND